MSKAVVVVESPAKAKTINKYLGKDFTVLASYGHVRDLPSKDGSVRPDEDFAMIYEVDADSKKQLSAIGKATKAAEILYLATDPDREGEAISWHVLEALKEMKALPKDIAVKRIVFTEITKRAVTEAVANPRDIDAHLVDAQQARRALDYLVGFNLSPILWRKLPGSKSAGRVQSVALRLLCEREAEIETFVAQEYWDIEASLATAKGEAFTAKLVEYRGEKLEKFSIPNAEKAREIEAAITPLAFQVVSATPKQMRRQPYAPFATSTLQMDASRKLGFSAKKTMQIAQKLYEGVDIGGETVGLITYMRTDGITVSTEAVKEARDYAAKRFGDAYVPASPRMYKTKSKNAQEAHEAIRPTDITRTPEQMAKHLDTDMARLYELIWKRMLASQMEAAVYDQMVVELTDAARTATLRANGSVLKFDGFQSLYNESRDEEDTDDELGKRLPPLAANDTVRTSQILPEQHFTQPPPRFSEASLVKRLEELGIGRPSTFASIISVLVDRNYATLDKRRFNATSLGRIVTGFLVSFFPKYVEYNFTADLEERLDLIADGERNWKVELAEFWRDFSARVEESKKLSIPEVLTAIDTLLEPYLYGTGEAAAKARICPKCSTGKLSLKTGKFGAFLGCSGYPECDYTRQLLVPSAEGAEGENAGQAGEFPRLLGIDEVTSEPITLRKGPYGLYVQRGEGKAVKRAGLPKGRDPNTIDLAAAQSLLLLPRELGPHPETGDMIVAGLGRFGPFLLHQKKYCNIPAGDDVLTIGMNRAVTLIAEAASRPARANAAEVLRNVGTHPETGEELNILKGRYGPYLKLGKDYVNLPKGADVATITLEEIVAAIAASGRGKKKAPAKKSAAKTKEAKPAEKKPVAKKATAKKSPAKPAKKSA